MARRTIPRPVRIGLWSLAGLVGLVIVAAVVIAVSFDADSLKPRVAAAVKQATGRDLTIDGRIRLGLSLQPTLVVSGVSLSNPPGFSRPQMATLDELDLKLALIPLLSRRVEIDRLVLVKPDILLETDAQGRANWQFTPQGTASPTQQPSSAAEQDKTRAQISVADIRVEHGTLTWRDDRNGRSTVIGITSLQASAPSPEATMHVTAAATYNGAPFTLAGDLGPLARLQQPEATTPWPVQMQVDAGGSKLAIDGNVTQPMQGRGYAAKVSGNIPDLGALAPFLPGQTLPPLHEVTFAAQVADSGGPVPRLSDLTLHVGPSDLSGMVAGLKIDKLDVSAAGLDRPTRIAGQGAFGGAPATVAGSLGAPAVLLPGAKAAQPIPLDLNVQALGSSLTAKGTAGIGAGGRPSVQADLVADKIDVDALRKALAKAPAQPAAAASPSPPTPAPAKPAANGRMIPDTPLPFAMLRLADADVKANIAQLSMGGAVYRAIQAHIDLHGGKLQVDPMTADLPEGHLNGSLSADAAQANPPVALRAQLPSLALKPLLAAMGQPDIVNGTLNVQADLRGAGTTPHAIAAGLDGSLSVTMGKGTVDNRLLGSALGSILREVNLLDLVGRGGTSEVECLVVNVAASHGVATFRSLVFASSLVTLDGDGSANLGEETLSLRVRPQARIAGTGIIVPLRINGPWRSPSTAPDPAAAVTQNAGTVAGTVLGGATPLGVIAGALGKQVLGGGAEASCAGPRSAAAPAQAAPPSAKPPKLPDVGGALKQLFR